MINMKELIKKQNNLIRKESGMIKEAAPKKWAVRVSGVGMVIVDAGSSSEAKRLVGSKLRGGVKDIESVTRAFPTKKVSDMNEEKKKITEGVDFKVVINDKKGKLIQGGNFTLKSDANLYIKDMIKKHKLRRGKGNWWNAKGVEMTTNF
mgnify:CR=1 FL=1